MKSAFVFVAQYIYITLLGLQQLNVVNLNYPGAALVSLMLGITGFSIVAAIAAAKGATWREPLWWAYILAGPLGIWTAMAVFG